MRLSAQRLTQILTFFGFQLYGITMVYAAEEPLVTQRYSGLNLQQALTDNFLKEVQRIQMVSLAPFLIF